MFSRVFFFLAAVVAIILLAAPKSMAAAFPPPEPLPSVLQPDNAKPSPRAKLDLSMPPHLRWKSIVSDIISRHGFEHSFGPTLAAVDAAMTKTPALVKLAQMLEGIGHERFPVYQQELEGIVDTLAQMGYSKAQGVSNEVLTAINWLMEIKAVMGNGNEKLFADVPLFGALACTSIVVRGPDGRIRHARNDDVDATKKMRNITVDIDIVDEKRGIIGKSTAFVMMIGMFTSMRSGVAALTQDERVLAVEPSLSQFIAMLQTHKHMMPAAVLMRNAMIDSTGGPAGGEPASRDSFYAIRDFLMTAPSALPGYMVLSGVESAAKDQGAVILRNRTAEYTQLYNLLHNTTHDVPWNWTTVVTNWNPLKPLPPAAKKYDPRRYQIVDFFKAKGRAHVTRAAGLLETLSLTNQTASTNGVLNIGTVFTVFMMAETNQLQSYLRNWEGCCG